MVFTNLRLFFKNGRWNNFDDITESKRPDDEMASKSRNANFSEEEKLLLAELGKQYPDIENKAYDNGSLKRKKTSWEKN